MAGHLLRWVVAREASGTKLLKYINLQLEGKYSLKAIKRVLDQYGCAVNDRKERFANALLSCGDRIAFDTSLLEQQKKAAFDKNLVLFEDDAFIIYNKPSGLVFDQQGLLTLLQKVYPNLIPVHRLDKETSGAIIYAKSEKIKEKFIQLFKAKEVHKKYLALVDGHPKTKRGTVTMSLGKVRQLQGQVVWGSVPLSKGGHTAETRWEIVQKGAAAALILCEPITGRTHQIRLHMSLLGHPILGDHLYGKNFKCHYPAKRHLLHAWKLVFPHPESGKLIDITASLPQDFLEAQTLLMSGVHDL